MINKIRLICVLLSVVSHEAVVYAAVNGQPKMQCFQELPLTAIKPGGWLLEFLQTQRDGLTGHLQVAGYPFNTDMWAGESIGDPADPNSWAAYEQTAYYIDALVKTGILLNDTNLIAKAKAQIDYVLDHAGQNGYLGPKQVTDTRWPQVVFFRALMAWYSATGDERIVPAMEKHYLGDISDMQSRNNATFEGNTFGRNDCHVEGMCWVYNHTGNPLLLDYAQKIFVSAGLEKWMTGDKPVAHMHGVSYSEKIKLPIILYMYTGNNKYLADALGGFHKGEEHRLVDGVPSSTEGLSGQGSRVCHETCVNSDYSWSCGYMMMALREGEWGDRIERICFNAGPGAVDKNFKTHQYLSSPNQVLATRYSNHEEHHANRMEYCPAHPVKCCTGNVHRFMPNYASRTWLSDGTCGLVAALYAPCKVTASVGKECREISITEDTEYPYEDAIRFTITSSGAVEFPLWFRIPVWCSSAQIAMNGKVLDIPAHPGTFVKLEQIFNSGDVITLTFPPDIKMTHWPRGGVALERGPLVYSFPVPVKREKVQFIGAGVSPNADWIDDWPAWDLLPAGEWQYALDIDEDSLKEKVKFIKNAGNPGIPVCLQVPARRILSGWDLQSVDDPKKGKLLCTPDLPDMTKVQLSRDDDLINLVPMGSIQLRLTVFPQVTDHPVPLPDLDLAIDSYKVNVPAASVHRDTDPPSRLTDGRWGSAMNQGVQYNDDAVITAKLKKTASAQEVIVYFYHFKGCAVGSISVETSKDGDHWDVVGTRNIICDLQPDVDIPAYSVAIPVNREAAYVRFTVKRAEESSRMILGEIVIK